MNDKNQLRPPISMKAGDKRVLVNGRALPVDFRIISEENYRKLKEAYDLVHEIEWEQQECMERDEGIYRIIGYDKLNNKYEASGIYSCGELVEVEDIEFMGK